MRTISTEVLAIIDEMTADYFILIDLELNTQTYRFTTLPYNIEVGGQTYLSDGGTFEYEEPRFSSVVDRESYKISILDHLHEMRDEFEAGVIGKDILVRVGFLDATGAPLTDEEDLLVAYSGYIDSPAVIQDSENRYAVLEGTSPMADLDRIRTFLTSKNGMDQVSATDTSFDSIYTDTEVELKWGKI